MWRQAADAGTDGIRNLGQISFHGVGAGGRSWVRGTGDASSTTCPIRFVDWAVAKQVRKVFQIVLAVLALATVLRT